MGLEHPLHLIAFEQPTQLQEAADICDQIYSYTLGPICQEQKHHLQNAIDSQLQNLGYLLLELLFHLAFLYRNKQV